MFLDRIISLSLSSQPNGALRDMPPETTKTQSPTANFRPFSPIEPAVSEEVVEIDRYCARLIQGNTEINACVKSEKYGMHTVGTIRSARY